NACRDCHEVAVVPGVRRTNELLELFLFTHRAGSSLLLLFFRSTPTWCPSTRVRVSVRSSNPRSRRRVDSPTRPSCGGAFVTLVLIIIKLMLSWTMVSVVLGSDIFRRRNTSC
ncbi:unnamed protein product, partial [Ectocarpus sp. 12 AP-2014]